MLDEDITLTDLEVEALLAYARRNYLVRDKWPERFRCMAYDWRFPIYCLCERNHTGPHMNWKQEVGAGFLKCWAWWNENKTVYKVFYL